MLSVRLVKSVPGGVGLERVSFGLAVAFPTADAFIVRATAFSPFVLAAFSLSLSRSLSLSLSDSLSTVLRSFLLLLARFLSRLLHKASILVFGFLLRCGLAPRV